MDLNKYICMYDDTLVNAMKKIDINAAGIVYVTDENKKLIGSLSDGDIRRWILKTGLAEGTALEASFRKVKFIVRGEKVDYNVFMKENGIQSVPIVNKDNHIIDIKFLCNDFSVLMPKCTNALSSIPVIVMAGGKGTRLYPFTKILPKPLIPIGDVPILERILNRFYNCGAREFYLTINYKKEMIKSYFNEASHPYVIHFVEENKPMGTAGSIRLIDNTFYNPVLITNCDILIKTDYEGLLNYHMSSKNDMTIVSSLKNILIPYGVLETRKKGIIISIHEKPQVSYMINTGMYLVNPEFLGWIPEDRVFHMIELAELMMAKGKQVGMYPISEESFLDMGEFEEMKKMEERINDGYVE